MESVKTGNGPAQPRQQDDVSRIGFRGWEDLGGGLKANYWVETAFTADANTPTALGSNLSIVGLSNQHGSVDLGRGYNNVFNLLFNHDPYGPNIGTNMGKVHELRGVRINNGVFTKYNVNKNITVKYSQGVNETNVNGDIKDYAVDAVFGPVTASLAHVNDGAGSKTTIGGFNYRLLDTTTVFTSASDNKNANGTSSNGKSIGVRHYVAPKVRTLAQYGENENIKTASGGVTYEFSKRTFAHVRYAKDTARTNLAVDREAVSVGLQHNF
jgi:predicted porin